MGKFFYLVLILACFISCSKSDDETIVSEPVNTEVTCSKFELKPTKVIDHYENGQIDSTLITYNEKKNIIFFEYKNEIGRYTLDVKRGSNDEVVEFFQSIYDENQSLIESNRIPVTYESNFVYYENDGNRYTFFFDNERKVTKFIEKYEFNEDNSTEYIYDFVYDSESKIIDFFVDGESQIDFYEIDWSSKGPGKSNVFFILDPLQYHIFALFFCLNFGQGNPNFDSLDNKIDYTIDSEGRVIEEIVDANPFNDLPRITKIEY